MTRHELGTVCVQGGWRPKNGEPRQLPIVQSTTFKYDSGQAANFYAVFNIAGAGDHVIALNGGMLPGRAAYCLFCCLGFPKGLAPWHTTVLAKCSVLYALSALL